MTSVIVSGARTPMGKLLGNLKDFPATKLGGVAIKAALERAGVAPGPGAVRDHGPGAAGRRRSDPGPPGGGQRRHPDEHAGADDQQGVPVRPGRDRAGRPADPRRRVRHRRRRRHGVDDERAAPADEPAAGLQVRRRRHQGPHGARRPHRRLRRVLDGRVDRAPQRAATASPASSRTSSAPRATSAPRPRRRTASSPRRSPPVEIPQRKGDPLLVLEDEGIRPETTAESLAKLRPAFAKDGTITAGTSLADLRRRGRRRRDEQGQGRGAGPGVARRDRRARQRRRSGQLAARAAGQRHRARAAQGRHDGRRTST